MAKRKMIVKYNGDQMIVIPNPELITVINPIPDHRPHVFHIKPTKDNLHGIQSILKKIRKRG